MSLPFPPQQRPVWHNVFRAADVKELRAGESLWNDGRQQELLFWYQSSETPSTVEFVLSHRSQWNNPPVRWIPTDNVPARLSDHYRAAVFTGLRPSRKPRWVHLLLHRPLRLPLSQQGPRSRRRRSWALTMRSKRTPQTTAKVRRTRAHSYHLSPRVTSALYVRQLASDSASVCSSPLSSLHPDASSGGSVEKTRTKVVTSRLSDCCLRGTTAKRPTAAHEAKGCTVC